MTNDPEYQDDKLVSGVSYLLICGGVYSPREPT